MTERTEWIKEQKIKQPNSQDAIINFIADLRFRNGIKESKLIQRLCTAGHCFYFAGMLQDIFNVRPFLVVGSKHVIAVDDTGVAYDINGVYDTKDADLIDIRYLSDKKMKEIKCGSPY